MSIVIDANMRLFANRLNITSSRMINDYGASTVDEIIEAEAAQGNHRAFDHAREYYHSPIKLVEMFKLNNVNNRYDLINNMDSSTRAMILPMLKPEDLVMGLHFFTQEKLLKMLMKVDVKEVMRACSEVFSLEGVIKKFTEDELSNFFKNIELNKKDVIKQMKKLPLDVMKLFIESSTGRPYEQTKPLEFINYIDNLPDKQYKKFVSTMNPDVQRQLVFQLAKETPECMELFGNEAYVRILSTLYKPDMVKTLVRLEEDSLISMISELPENMISIVGAQIGATDLATFLQDGRMKLIEKALMI